MSSESSLAPPFVVLRAATTPVVQATSRRRGRRCSRSIMNVWAHTSRTKGKMECRLRSESGPSKSRRARCGRAPSATRFCACRSRSAGAPRDDESSRCIFDSTASFRGNFWFVRDSFSCHTAVECTYSYACRTLARGGPRVVNARGTSPGDYAPHDAPRRLALHSSNLLPAAQGRTRPHARDARVRRGITSRVST